MPLAGWGVLRSETSPLSPLPSPSHRPGEGDLVEAVLPIGCVFAPLSTLIQQPTSTTAPTAFPSPGRWEGDGRGDRGEVSEGRTPQPARGIGDSSPSLHLEQRSPRIHRGPGLDVDLAHSAVVL